MATAKEQREAVPELSEKQRACLEHFARVRDGRGWEHGAGTLTSLRKLGLLERFDVKLPALQGGRSRTERRWRLTEAGHAWIARSRPTLPEPSSVCVGCGRASVECACPVIDGVRRIATREGG